MPRVIAVAVWFIFTVVLVMTAPSATISLHGGACNAIGESAEWYATCRADVASQMREEQRPSMEDRGRRIVASALTLAVLIGFASYAERSASR